MDYQKEITVLFPMESKTKQNKQANKKHPGKINLKNAGRVKVKLVSLL